MGSDLAGFSGTRSWLKQDGGFGFSPVLGVSNFGRLTPRRPRRPPKKLKLQPAERAQPGRAPSRGRNKRQKTAAAKRRRLRGGARRSPCEKCPAYAAIFQGHELRGGVTVPQTLEGEKKGGWRKRRRDKRSRPPAKEKRPWGGARRGRL